MRLATQVAHTSNADDQKAYGSDRIIWSQIENYYEIEQSFTADPVFSIRVTKGNVQISTTRGYQHPSGLAVWLTEIPEPGEAEFEVTCTVNGKVYTQIIRMEFVALSSLPDGMEIGQKVPLVRKVGDSIYFSNVPTSFTNHWSVGNSHTTETAMWGNVYSATDNGNWAVPGVYHEMQIICVEENVNMHQTMDVIVTGQDGTMRASEYTPFGTVATVPADLKVIESQAFAGTQLTEIDIPAGVSIAADAFDGTGLIAIYCHDQATIDYAVQNGYVAVVE